MGNRWVKSIVIVVVALIATAVGDVCVQRNSPRKVAPKSMEAMDVIRAKMLGMTGGYLPIALDISGVNDPRLVTAVESGIKDDDIVIGVVAFGESRAYLRSAFDGAPDRHIVNDKFGSVPVSITHCDRTRCTRVLTSDTLQNSINIRCGGWLAVQEMALLVDSTTYAQSSQEIPLEDLPFVVTTWKAWVSTHPGALVYVGKQQEG
jgi:hypothetical protein